MATMHISQCQFTDINNKSQANVRLQQSIYSDLLKKEIMTLILRQLSQINLQIQTGDGQSR